MLQKKAKEWLVDTIDSLPKFRLCRDTGTRVTGEKCPVHDQTACVFLYVNVTSVMEHA